MSDRLGKAQVKMLRDCWRFRDDHGCPLDYVDRPVARRLAARGLVRIHDHDSAFLTSAGREVLERIGFEAR